MTPECKNCNTWKVYMHISPSGKKYIGITSRKTYKRWGGKGQYYKECPYFYNAIQKYGWENIKHEILNDSLSYKEAIELEKYYIELYDTNNPDFGYNLTKGGEGHNGYKLSEEKKKILSEKRQGVNALNYNNFPSDETKKKMSESAKNKIFTDETKEKMSKEKMKTVYMYTLEGVFIKSFPSASEASKKTGVNLGNICSCCRNIIKKPGGYFWSYKKIDNPQLIIDHISGINPFEPVYSRNEKPVYKMTLNDEIICRYNSIKEASLDTNIPAQEISQACKNNKKVTREYKWKYA